MPKLKRLFFNLVFTFTCVMAQDTTEVAPFRILFIGNSVTYWNAGLAYYFEKLTASMNPPLIVEADQEAEPAASLRTHWYLGTAVKRIQRVNYDVVVLQGSPVYDSGTEHFNEAAPKFIEESNKVGTKPILFMEWQCPTDTVTLDAIVRFIETAATEFAVEVIPAGIAFQKSIEQRPELNLFGDDNCHESVAGSYLIVSVIYAVLFNQSPVGATYLPFPEGSLLAEDAAFLQQIAWETVQEYKER
jgi:hypothetical protein